LPFANLGSVFKGLSPALKSLIFPTPGELSSFSYFFEGLLVLELGLGELGEFK